MCLSSQITDRSFNRSISRLNLDSDCGRITRVKFDSDDEAPLSRAERSDAEILSCNFESPVDFLRRSTRHSPREQALPDDESTTALDLDASPNRIAQPRQSSLEGSDVPVAEVYAELDSSLRWTAWVELSMPGRCSLHPGVSNWVKVLTRHTEALVSESAESIEIGFEVDATDRDQARHLVWTRSQRVATELGLPTPDPNTIWLEAAQWVEDLVHETAAPCKVLPLRSHTAE